jgi:hypothetical protein
MTSPRGRNKQDINAAVNAAGRVDERLESLAERLRDIEDEKVYEYLINLEKVRVLALQVQDACKVLKQYLP